jgi:hypothetical protein
MTRTQARPIPPAERPLWTCPRCGKRFVTPNLWHSCQTRSLDEHFTDRPRARELFEAFRTAVETLGPVALVLNKTGIGFMTRVRFTGVQPRRDYLRAGVWLKRRVHSPRFVRVDWYGHDDWVHFFEIRSEGDIDAELIDLLREARAVGDQDHLRRRATASVDDPGDG